jgi:hypothetical protein
MCGRYRINVGLSTNVAVATDEDLQDHVRRLPQVPAHRFDGSMAPRPRRAAPALPARATRRERRGHVDKFLGHAAYRRDHDLVEQRRRVNW